MRKILGIRYGHDAAASLVIDGKIIVDVAEERFTRLKHDGSFPLNAIRFCLEYAGITTLDLDALAIPARNMSDEFGLHFSHPAMDICPPPAEPQGFQAKLKARLCGAPARKKLRLPLYMQPMQLSEHCQIINYHHHKCHAASAYYTSGMKQEKVLVAVLDGRGDGESTSFWEGRDNGLTKLKSWGAEASLGWFFSAATEALGWRHGGNEWKTMGLAPYGTPHPGALDGLHPVFKDGELVTPYPFQKIYRLPERGVNHYHMPDAAKLSPILEKLGREDFAAEAQRVLEEQALKAVIPWLSKVGTRKMCCAGGLFQSVKLNQRVWETGALDEQWIFPNPGDAGLASGAALLAYYEANPKAPNERQQDMYLGPEFTDKEIEDILNERKLTYTKYADAIPKVAEYLADNKIIGWFQGRMESGQRALGNRSILMSPLRAQNKDIINAAVKFREPFRPFCPSIMEEKREDYIANGRDERYMITSFDVTEEKREAIPAVVHVDGTLRPQTVVKSINPRYHALIKAFGDTTGEYVLLNTSFNVRGEPIVCTPREAIRCFYDNGLDVLVLGDYMITKA
ncbi:carbamoyltransferase C-terminal domain-containing protein [uncultured Pseudodesulfovibrio sp.]|uniref:carbamoyltransferase family protein n=1 Tax=uncultured Pseudodesulfovibrio sp. TaxID=2035858 RepID=UPI0029C79177|nr:carbamoyltransferase C-terminal domain-containing protein [uncultured Pseudodesulfovibrio sp.]